MYAIGNDHDNRAFTYVVFKDVKRAEKQIHKLLNERYPNLWTGRRLSEMTSPECVDFEVKIWDTRGNHVDSKQWWIRKVSIH
jgi:hypothetical protein